MAETLNLQADVVRKIEAGTETASTLHRYAIAGLHFERAQTDAKCVTAKMLSSAQAILRQAGYEVVVRRPASVHAGKK